MRVVFIAAALFLLASAAQAAGPIAGGVYHCKAGSSRLMITLGDMTVSGSRYQFKAPTGAPTSGSYSVSGSGYKWNGDIGAIKNSQIVESGPDASPGYFYFTYRVGSSSPTTASCGKM